MNETVTAVYYAVNTTPEASENDILQASVNALMLMLTDPANTPAISVWEAGQIRKLTKRGKQSAYARLNTEDTLNLHHSVHNNAEVTVVAPISTDTQPPALKRLQVTGFDLPHETLPAPQEPHLRVEVNNSLRMSTGKLLAQVGHAAQLFHRSNHPEAAAWTLHPLIHVVHVETFTTNHHVQVRDAGFTEIPANSLTVTATHMKGITP